MDLFIMLVVLLGLLVAQLAVGLRSSTSSSITNDKENTIRTSPSSLSPSAWYTPANLPEHTNFTEEIRLLALATKLSYTATYGSYYENWTIDETLGPSWVKDFKLSPNPEHGGMHALTFINNADGHNNRSTSDSDTSRESAGKRCRGLIAFRGTDLGSDVLSSLADNCADDLLWSGSTYLTLPPACRGNFTANQLDYFALAVNLTNEAMSKYPMCSFLFTGHSLGAGLANLVAAVSTPEEAAGAAVPSWAAKCVAPSAGAAVFSSPGYIATLLNHTNVTFPGMVSSVNNTNSDRFVLFADEFDPVWYSCNRSFQGGHLGRRCLWHDGPEPLPCALCEVPSTVRNLKKAMENVFCDWCMSERHLFSHYLKLIDGGGRTPKTGLHCVADGYENYPTPCASGSTPGCKNLVSTGCRGSLVE